MRSRRLRIMGPIVPVVVLLTGAAAAQPSPSRDELPRPPAPAPVAPPAQTDARDFTFAVTLLRAGLKHAALRHFTGIAQNPRHPSFAETLPWLGTLSASLPDAAGVEGILGAYSLAQLRAASGALPPDVAWRLSYLFGRQRYEAGADAESLEALRAVAPQSAYWGAAQLWTAAASVRQRQSVPAMNALHRLVAALDEGQVVDADPARLRDLALLSIARIFAGAAIRKDENDQYVVDQSRLSAAAKFIERLDPASEEWPDAARDLTWIELVAGNLPKARGYARARAAVSRVHGDDALLVMAFTSFVTCDTASAETALRTLQARFGPVRAELVQLLSTLREGAPDAALRVLASANDPRVSVDARVAIGRARLVRPIARQLDYLASLASDDAGLGRAFASAPPVLVGEERQAIAAERARALSDLTQRLRAHLVAAIAEIDESLADGAALDADLAAQQRNQLDAGKVASLVPLAEAATLTPRLTPVLSPFLRHLPDEYRRYEGGYYHVPMVTRCGR